MASRKPAVKDIPKDLRPRCQFDNSPMSGVHRHTGWNLCARHLAQANGYGQHQPTTEESTWQPPS